jgi:hypothetical protein
VYLLIYMLEQYRIQEKKKSLVGGSNMIQRTVLLKFAETTTQEQMEEVIKRFKALERVITGVVEIQAGFNLSQKSKEYQVILMVRFENVAAVEAYTINEQHQEVAAFIREVGRLDSIGVDIEI